jgi:hypothetical protein
MERLSAILSNDAGGPRGPAKRGNASLRGGLDIMHGSIARVEIVLGPVAAMST